MSTNTSNRHLAMRAFAALLLSVAFVFSETEVAYFWVSHPLGRSDDGYVLPLHEAEDIAAARAQLQLEPRERLGPLARIAPGGDGINRNLIAPGRPRWSWHVVEFLHFAQGVVYLGGDPSVVEQNVELFMQEYDGLIFFGYRPIRELMLEELFATWIEITPEGVDVRWLDLGTNYLYTVEIAEPMTPTVWGPALGVWPIAGTNWIDSAPAPMGRYYRVRAAKPAASPP